ncbi:hypothetical protein H5410_045304, partial [Solanum commersonii]
ILVSKQAKNEDSKRPKPKLLELKPFESSSSSKPSPNLELKNLCFIDVLLYPSPSSCFGSLGDSTASRNCSVTRRLLLFTADLILSFTAQHSGTKCKDKTFWRLAERFSRSKKCVSNSATQDSIMNAHNKTQFTYAKIKCALKDSSCDSLISKNLMLTILASNVSLSSTKVFKCPHIRNDSIFTHNGLQFKDSESNVMLTLTKMNMRHTFTHRFACICRSTFVSSHSRSQRSFQDL